MKKIFFTISLFCAVAANACQCPLPIPPFHYATCTMFNSYGSDMADKSIVIGVIAGHYEYGTYLKILEPIYDSVNNDTILVWGNTRFTCRTDLMAFEETDTLILVVRRVQNAHSELEHFTDYWISACATNYLYYSNNMVTDYIDEGISSMPYNDFVQMLQECLPVVGIQTLPLQQASAQVSPNPFTSQTTITLSGAAANTPLQLTLYDITGRQLHIQTAAGNTITLQRNNLPAGIYLYAITTATGTTLARGKLAVE